jgi:hypothetical protein
MSTSRSGPRTLEQLNEVSVSPMTVKRSISMAALIAAGLTGVDCN